MAQRGCQMCIFHHRKHWKLASYKKKKKFKEAKWHQLIVQTWDVCKLCHLSFVSRWRYGSRTSVPNTKRSWRMAPVDPKGSTWPHRRHPLPLHAHCGTSAWLPKGHRCTLVDTWTILLTGTLDTSRTPCQGLRWCDRLEDISPFGLNHGFVTLSKLVVDMDIVAWLRCYGSNNSTIGRD